MPLAQHETDASPTAGEIETWPKLKLSAPHAKLWEETRAAMLWAVPSFSDIWLAMMVDRDGESAWFTDCIDTAATDDKFLYVNPEWFFALTLDERLFVCCHEIEHAMYGHAGTGWILSKQGHITYSDGVSLPYDGDLMNRAMDYVINDQLVVAKIGTMPENGCHWPALVNGDMSVLDAYRLIYKQQQGGGKSRNGQPKTGGGGLPGEPFDKLLRPGQGRGKSANKAVSERSQSEWDTTITAAMEAAKVRGQLPSNLDRAFTKRLQPKADWRDLYMLAVSRKIGNDRYTWSHLNQQLAYRRIGAPGRTTYGCDMVAIAVDTSGSINQRTLDVFLAETMALLEQAKPRRVLFVQCDAKIHEWEIIEGADDLYGRKIKGGGGSATEPVFERMDAEGLTPDLLVYLTDLDISVPSQKPSYPVVWGCIDANAKAPWGEFVFVPPQAEVV
jgi:predicted metal-dependent peptidase